MAQGSYSEGFKQRGVSDGVFPRPRESVVDKDAKSDDATRYRRFLRKEKTRVCSGRMMFNGE